MADATLEIIGQGVRSTYLTPRQSLKQEALDHFMVFGEAHFNYIVSQYVDYYHGCRPHQGIGNVLLPKPRGEQEEEPDVVSIDLATVKCESRLGGLLKHYYHDAA